jgi:uncharacterized membrane protein
VGVNSSFWRHYLVTFVVFLVVDAVWLALVAPRFYQSQIGPLMAKQPRWAAAGVFYLLFVAGLVVFCVSPGVRQGSLGWVALRGVLFGLVTYGTYALTNLAVLEGWTPLVAIVDLGWGVVLATATSVLSVWLARLWG